MSSSEMHVFVPQNQIAHAINDRFLGLYHVEEVPEYYRPTPEAVEFSERLIGAILDGTVELVLGDGLGDRDDPSWEAQRTHGVQAVVGPANIQHILLDLLGASSFLWDQGATEVNDGIDLIPSLFSKRNN